ncbi:MAG: hypothetical protein FH756_09180 [Firmicutes bacterium]|nr:hypothetical protein [Bacillota bacterium]
MATGFSKKRPTFTQFHNLFVEILNTNNCNTDTFSRWNEIGDINQRALILAAFRDKLITDFGLGKDFEINKQLLELDGPVESVITQFFHSISTLSLVEHINETIIEQQKARRGEN